MLRDLFSLFPAHAGVILVRLLMCKVDQTFPRTCGGDPYYWCGNSYGVRLFPAHAGVIPFAPKGRS